MNSNYNLARSALVDITKDIDQQVYKKSRLRPEWGGADVLITSQSRKSTDNGSFYPEPRTELLLMPEKLEVHGRERDRSAIAQSPPAKLAELGEWFGEFHAWIWDRQLEEDLKAGRLLAQGGREGS